MQGAFFRTNKMDGMAALRAPSGERRVSVIQNVERRSAPARPIKALPDKSSQIGSSACDVWATTDAMPAATSARPYATALAAARRTSISTANTFMSQPVANLSNTSSYFRG